MAHYPASSDQSPRKSYQAYAVSLLAPFTSCMEASALIKSSRVKMSKEKSGYLDTGPAAKQLKILALLWR